MKVAAKHQADPFQEKTKKTGQRKRTKSSIAELDSQLRLDATLLEMSVKFRIFCTQKNVVDSAGNAKYRLQTAVISRGRSTVSWA